MTRSSQFRSVFASMLKPLVCTLSKWVGYTSILATFLFITSGNAQDCASVQARGINTSAIYSVNRASCNGGTGCIFDVLCDLTTDGGRWTVIQQRTNGGVDFWQSWNAYKTGFGNLTNDFWAGNEYVYELTSAATYELMVWLQPSANTSNTTTLRYDSFRLQDESNNYALQLGTLTTNATDFLEPCRNQPFGTWDKDTDTLPNVRCGVWWRSGWWFASNCNATANLNLPYGPMSRKYPRFQDGLYWPVPVPNNIMKLKAAKMMIRPRL